MARTTNPKETPTSITEIQSRIAHPKCITHMAQPIHWRLGGPCNNRTESSLTSPSSSSAAAYALSERDDDVNNAPERWSVLADDRNDHRAASGAIVDRATGGPASDLTETLNVVVGIFQGGQQV